jgi:hypothetical protein
MLRAILVLIFASLLLCTASCDLIKGGQLEGKVKKALAADPRTASSDFEVAAEPDGTVTITGEVTGPEESAAVTEIAQAVEGVTKVVNNTAAAEPGSTIMQDTVVDTPYL